MGASAYEQAKIKDNKEIETWVKARKTIAFQKLLDNISPVDGEEGAVLASPSRVNPDYYYHWVRDAARTMRNIINVNLTSKEEDKSANKNLLGKYVEFSRINQVTPSPSNSLGEPKFNVNGSAFTGPWGRPQNDGPAERAITLIRWANQLLATGNVEDKSYVTGVLYDSVLPTNSVVKADLEFVAHHWQEPCFDLWEEVNGTHFFTRLNQRTALREGAALAEQLDDQGAADFYNQQAQAIENEMDNFWDAENNRLKTTINYQGGLNYKDKNLDAAILIGSIQIYSQQFPYYTPTNDRILATAYALYLEFKDLYPINTEYQYTAEGLSIFPGIGRYPEDKYTGYNSDGQGNPWFICTLPFSALCYISAELFKAQKSIDVNAQNIDFFNLALTVNKSSLKINIGDTLKDKNVKQIIDSLIELGNSVLRRVQLHAADDGSLSEEFSKDNGYMTGANDLTWSYAALITAANWKLEDALQF